MHFCPWEEKPVLLTWTLLAVKDNKTYKKIEQAIHLVDYLTVER